MKRIAFAALLAAASAAVAFRSAEGPKLAVIDMSRLVSQHKQSRDEQALIDQWRAVNRGLIDEREKAYKAEVATLDQFKEGSEEYLKKARALKIMKFELENDVDGLNDEFEGRVARSIADAHARVVAACRAYAEAHDLDAILQFANSPVSGRKSSDVIPEIVVRTVVAHKKSIDVSDGVLAILDSGK